MDKVHQFCPECGTGIGIYFRAGETPGKCCNKYIERTIQATLGLAYIPDLTPSEKQ